jgi:hypothetical protein
MARWNDPAARRFEVQHRRQHFSGWAGRVFWPYAYTDVLYPVIWASTLYDPFWSYGYSDIYDSVFWPSAGVSGTGSSRRARVAARGDAQTGALPAQLCGEGPAADLIDFPIDAIEQAVRPDKAQQAALDALGNAMIEGSQTIRAACPTEEPLTPPGRLDVMEKRIAAMVQAVKLVRPALEKFYNLLSDEQRARFNTLAGPRKSAQARAGASACDASGIPQWPQDRIEDAVRPTPDQRAGLDALQQAVTEAADKLKASCTSELPLTVPGRLDAVTKRLDAYLQAVQAVHRAMDSFYGSLTEEQKARFNTVGQKVAGRR